MILGNARKYLSNNGADVGLIRNSGSVRLTGSYGNYARSRKQADGTIVYSAGGVADKVVITIEIGYTEDYAALCRDKDVWIQGRHVKVCILVCLDELPRFRNPRALHVDVGDVNNPCALAQGGSWPRQ
ncbi:hypothetical protein V1505DRAFT_381579 [Lipomyces doorenjongii]